MGSIFRTADAAGVDRIYLTGYTPQPTDRFGRVQPEIAKTSLGANESVPWEYHENIAVVIEKCAQAGATIVAVEQHPHAVSYTEFIQPEHVAYIFGNEIDGVPEAVCTTADCIIEIPMHGTKESLNVSVCAGIVLFNTR